MVVTGYEKGSLLDFNYKIEPLPGKFPFPGIGPLDLLGVTFSNYVGKMMFRWVYFNMMLKGATCLWNPSSSWPARYVASSPPILKCRQPRAGRDPRD